MIITIKYDKPTKLGSSQSAYISFDFSRDIVDAIRTISIRYYNVNTKIWEIPYYEVDYIKSILPQHKFKIIGKPIDKETSIKKEPTRDYKLPKGLKTNLMQHQIDGFNECLNNNKYLVLFEQGLGKSLCALSVGLKRKELNNIKHCLIICGVNSIKFNWIEEINTHTNSKGFVLGSRKNKYGEIDVKGNAEKLYDISHISEIKEYFLITNVETLRSKEFMDKLKKVCENGYIDMVIFDEFHKACNPTSQQGKATLKLAQMVKYFYGLTGTAIRNSPLNLYLPLKCVDAEKFNFTAFKRYFCIFGGYGNYQVVGYRHLDILQEKTNKSSIRRTKEEVLDLPEKVIMDEVIDMGDSQKKLYKDIVNVVMKDIDKIMLSPDPLSQLIRLRQCTASTEFFSDSISESAKFDRALEIIEDNIEDGKKVVVFSNWVRVIDLFEKRLTKHKTYAKITGEVKNRMEEVNKFQNDPNCKLIIGTTGAMGTGLTLTAGTIVIFLDMPWTSSDYDQAVDRCYRIGTTDTVFVYNLICRNTIDERVSGIVKRKRVMSDALVDKKYDIRDANVIKYLITGEGEI